MKRILLFLFILAVFAHAQTSTRFVNYGPKAAKSEGDDNYVQVINIRIPDGYVGKINFMAYDMNCAGEFDMAIGTYDSKFRFSLYKGELREESFTNSKDYKTQIIKSLLNSIEVGSDSAYNNKWNEISSINAKLGDERVYSLLIESLEGNDANIYKIAVNSDFSSDNMEGISIYSYEPTIHLSRDTKKMSYMLIPSKAEESLILHTFDFDKTKIFFSTLLQDEIPIIENKPKEWSAVKHKLNFYERGNPCTLDIGPESKTYNDLTFKVTDESGNKYPIETTGIEKVKAMIPIIKTKITNTDCSTVVLDASQSASKQLGDLSFIWKDLHSIRGTASKVILRHDESGKYSVELFVEEKSKAITHAKLENIEYIINKKPIAVAGNNKIGAPQETLLFDAAKSFDSDGKLMKYIWQFGDGVSATGVTTKHAYQKSGIYKVVLKVEDNFDPICNYCFDTLLVNINSQPVLKYKELPKSSVNQILTFDATESYDTDGNIISCTWDFGKYGKREGSKVEMSFPIPAKYNIGVIITDNSLAKNNSARKDFVVFINDPPVANAGVAKTIADKQEIVFDASKSKDSDGKIIKYEWDFGDRSNGIGQKVNHSFNLPGKYFVKLKVTDDSGTRTNTDLDSIQITVNNRPIAVIENEKYLKDGAANFDASKSYDIDGTITKYIWNLGDGNTAEGKNLVYYYKLPGRYKVILKVIDNTNTINNSSSDTSEVIINKRPIADAGPDYVIAPNQKITFNSSNSVDPDGLITKSRWFLNSKLVSEGVIFDYQFTEPGINLIELEVNDNFVKPLKGYDEAVVKVNHSPIAKINASAKGIPNQILRFNAANSFDSDGTIKEYNWKFSDGQSKTGKNVEKTFQNPGIYSVVLTVVDDAKVSNSFSSDTIYIKINSEPVIKISETMETCESIVTFDASESSDADGDPLSFYWDFPDAKNIKGSGVISHMFNQHGIIPVTLTIDDGNGLSNSIAKKTIQVKVHQPPIADAGPDTTVCTGDIVIFNGLRSKVFERGLLEYEWVFDDSTKLIGSSVVKVFKKGGLYKVILKVTDDSGLPCNFNRDSKIVKVVEAPISNAGADIEACVNTPVKFDGSKSSDVDGIVNSFEWDFGDGDTGGGMNPIHIYTKPGYYKAILTISGDIKGECDNTSKDEVMVKIINAPLATFVSKDSIPEGEVIKFDASNSSTSFGNIIRYLWELGDGTVAEGKILEHTYKKYGIYNVTLSITTDLKNMCNSARFSKTIYVNSKPTAAATGNATGSINELITFVGKNSFDKDGCISLYKWNFGDGTSSEGIEKLHSFDKSGKYKVTLTVFDDTNVENNSDKDTIEVTINSSPIARFDAPDFSYIGKEITFNASSSYDNEDNQLLYHWYIDDELFSSEKVFSTTFNEFGIKKIRLVVEDKSDQFNRLDEQIKYLHVVDFMKIDLPEKIYMCSDETIELKPVILQVFEDPQISYVWHNENGKYIYNYRNLSISNLSVGVHKYVLELVGKDKTVMAKDSTVIQVVSAPKISFVSNSSELVGKANDEILFDATKYILENPSHMKVKWMFGDGQSSNLPIAIHKYEKEGEYKVELELDNELKTKCSITKQIFNVLVKKLK